MKRKNDVFFTYMLAMSVVTVQIGQCGNQIGCQFFSTVANDLQSSSNSRLFGDYEDECVDRFFSLDDHGKWTARAVMVDTEPKVLITVMLLICFFITNFISITHYTLQPGFNSSFCLLIICGMLCNHLFYWFRLLSLLFIVFCGCKMYVM